MSFARQKRLWLGVLAFGAPIPLPVSEVITWPVLLLYLAVVGAFLVGAWKGRVPVLGKTGLNVAGALYVPVLVAELQTLSAGLIAPVLHLALFVVAVKLFSLRQERDKWHSLTGSFFLFLASMGTAVHPSILVYLLLFMSVAVVVLLRFAYYSILSSFGQREPLPMPVGGAASVAVLGSLALAVPLFALLPRVGSPFLSGPGRGTGTIVHASGFTDEVTLDVIGAQRQNREVVLRLQSAGQPLSEEDLRFKAATFEHYDGVSWQRGNMRFNTRPQSDTLVLSEEPTVRTGRIWLQRLGSASLPLPMRTAVVAGSAMAWAFREPGGAVRLPTAPRSAIHYEVGLAARPVLFADPEAPVPAAPRADGQPGLTPRMAALARQVLGDGENSERIRRLERYLTRELTYTDEFLGSAGSEPVDSFLFEHRRGHCELFATAMVLLLRAEGIPARLVTGFLGGEYNQLEGYYAVRQMNAHAWVEAYSASGGWRAYDPTPPSGRPQAQSSAGWSLGAQLYDYLIFRWERYVLTFGVEDQGKLLRTLGELWRDLWQRLARQGAGREPDALPPELPDAALPNELAPLPRKPAVALWLAWTLAIGVAVAAAALEWRARRPLSGIDAYQRLRRRLERAGLAVDPATAPRELEAAALARFPSAAAPLRAVVGRYLVESFAREPGSRESSLALKQALDELRRRLPRVSGRSAA